MSIEVLDKTRAISILTTQFSILLKTQTIKIPAQAGIQK